METIREFAFIFRFLLGSSGYRDWYYTAVVITIIAGIIAIFGIAKLTHSQTYFDVLNGIIWFLMAFLAAPIVVDILLGIFPTIYAEYPAIFMVILLMIMSVILHRIPRPYHTQPKLAEVKR